MINKTLLCFLFACFTTMISGQNSVPERLVSLFQTQLEVFPQEKIYLHTDKPYYISGEKIWFRAYLADAKSHEPVPVSRYVYVELFNPLDSVVARIKIRREEGTYHGYLPVPEDVPEGDYVLRAYTAFMQNQDEDYFCTKTIRISDPQARKIRIETQFTFESDRRLQATFRFTNIDSSAPIIPQSVNISVNGGRSMNAKVDDDGTAGIQFSLPANSRKRAILLEVTESKNPYRQYIQVPVPDNDFDVSFYPEGGSLVQGNFCKVAFKAMKSNGQATNISGIIYDNDRTEIIRFQSEHIGMGSFPLLAEKGKTYYAVCENNKGQSKRFDLPAAVDHGYVLSVNRSADKIYVATLKPAETASNEELYLLVHTRGEVHYAERWNNERNLLAFRSSQFPSGLLHLILFDARLNPVSERLAFINNSDQAQITYHPDKENYTPRSLVKNSVTLTDNEGDPLTGSFSVAVTSDREVIPDSTSNILTLLLLASDLRGNIENPAYYFQNTAASVLALDLLMCTQGWRRYNIAELAKGRLSHPAIPIEVSSGISGTVKSGLLSKPAQNNEVNVMSFQDDFFEKVKTGEDGRFYLHNVEWTDSTEFIVSAKQGKSIIGTELILDKETFPARTLPVPPPVEISKNLLAKYADKAEQQYVYENGMRMIHLPEVRVSAERKQPIRKALLHDPDYDASISVITEETLKRSGATNLVNLLNMLPGVSASIKNGIEVDGVIIRNGMFKPLLVVDDVIWGGIDGINEIGISNIEQIDVLKGINPYGMRGAGGVVFVHTKRGGLVRDDTPVLHIKNTTPLGYQQPVEFYAPKYDTPEKRSTQAIDLRTTIHWQPVVQTDRSGVASFDFYTADESASYTVIIEGLADDGTIIRQESRLTVDLFYSVQKTLIGDVFDKFQISSRFLSE